MKAKKGQKLPPPKLTCDFSMFLARPAPSIHATKSEKDGMQEQSSSQLVTEGGLECPSEDRIPASFKFLQLAAFKAKEVGANGKTAKVDTTAIEKTNAEDIRQRERAEDLKFFNDYMSGLSREAPDGWSSRISPCGIESDSGSEDEYVNAPTRSLSNITLGKNRAHQRCKHRSAAPAQPHSIGRVAAIEDNLPGAAIKEILPGAVIEDILPDTSTNDRELLHKNDTTVQTPHTY